MELSEEPLPMALDLSKRCEKSHRNPRTTEVLDLVKKPSWRSISDNHHVSMPCMQILSEKTLADTGVRLSYGNRSCVHSPLLHNGMDRSLRDSGLYELNPIECPNAESPISKSMNGDESHSDSDVILLVSSSKEAPSPQDYIGPDVPLVEPLSPGAVSLDEAKGCFLLPQTMTSPSPDNTYSEDSSESTENRVNTKLVLNLSELDVVYGQSASSTVDMSSDDSDVIEVPVTNQNKKIPSFLVGVQNDDRLTGKSCSTVKKTLIPQPGRLSPVDTVQKPTSNIVHHHLKIHTKNVSTVLHKNNSGDTVDSKSKSSASEDESWLQPTVHLYRCVLDSDDSDMEYRTVRLDPSESLGYTRRLQTGTRLATSPKSSYVKDIQQETTTASSSSTQKSRNTQKTQLRRSSEQAKASNINKASGSKTRTTTKQRKKKHKKAGSSSLFSPQEPEIKLKYANYKNYKRDSKSENFSPFVHIEQREYSACTVINDRQDEEDVRQNKGQQKQPAGCGSVSGVVPKTSCYRLGRLSSVRKGQPLMGCCLCGGSANAVGLGDLHGPYYPDGDALEEHSKQQTQKEEHKDSELSADSKTGLCGQIGYNGLHELCNGPSIEAVDEDCCIIVSDCESSTLPSAKKLRTNCVVDGYGPPVVPHNTSERWIHEDCGIWSTGVFLVKGKLYGLDEAVRLAQDTVCSTCQSAGATMGCFQKACPKKYHYTCAALAGCVLNEDNFSMRCPKHKNTQFRSVNMPDSR